MRRPWSRTSLLWIASLSALLVCWPLQAQPAGQGVEEEDLPEPDVWEQIIPTYVEAEKVFNSRSQPDSLALFDEFLRQVEANRSAGEPPEEIHRLVANSVFYCAQVNFNLGKTEEVQADLDRLLAMEPGFEIDRNLVSSKFADQFDRAKKDSVGSAIFSVDPPDATIAVGRWKAASDGTIVLPVGTHIVTVTRPGYTSAEQEVAISTGETPTFSVTLERLAAVLTFVTSMDDVEVRVDGGPWQAARLGEADNDDTWRQWVLEWDARPGNHRLEVRAGDGSGETQTGDRAAIAPDGSTGWHSVTVFVE